MPALQMIAALILSTLATTLAPSPQGGSSVPHLRYPPDSAAIRLAPYVDASEFPLTVSARSLGAADFDGDGNQELWFLGDPGPSAGAISVQMPRTSDLGRFRAYTQLPNGDHTDGASYHSTASPTDFVLLTNPTIDRLEVLFYAPPSSGDPRSGSWWILDSSLAVGLGAYEIETADCDEDGHDDITVLHPTTAGGTMIRKLHMGMSAGSFGVLETTTIELPVVLRELRMLDLNGDDRSDVVFHAPGFGVFAYLDDGAGSFTPFFSLRFAGIPLNDLVVGDIDQDGRGDFALVFDIGVGVILSPSAGIQFAALFKPNQLGVLATAAILDTGADDGNELVMLPADGQALGMFTFDQTTSDFTAPIMESPWQTDLINYSGTGNPDLRALATDLDNDGDQELVLPMPDGQHWLSLRGPVVDLRPLDNIVVEDLGPAGESGFCEQLITLSLPDAWFTAGIPELEVAVFLERKDTLETLYWTRTFPLVDAQTRTASFGLMVQTVKPKVLEMIDSQQVQVQGLMTAGGPTMITMHGKNGTQRFASRILNFDGNGGGQGSEVGITWDVVAAPPTPDRDADLLPWN